MTGRDLSERSQTVPEDRECAIQGVWRRRRPSNATSVRRQVGRQYKPSHQVVGQRVPQRDTLDLGQTAYVEAEQAAVARDSVDAFGRGRALFVDRLGLVGAHAFTPGGDGRA